MKPGLRNCVKVSAIVGAFFLGSQYLLNLYFAYVYMVPVIFGSLTTGIILVQWLQFTGLITFYGAELIYVLENGELIASLRETSNRHLRALAFPEAKAP